MIKKVNNFTRKVIKMSKNKFIFLLLVFSIIMPTYVNGAILAERENEVNAQYEVQITNENISPYAEEPDYKLNGDNGEVKIYNPIINDDSTFSYTVEVPDGSTHITVSATGGKFVLPLYNSNLSNYGLEFLYGVNTETDTLIKSHTPTTEYGILTFKAANAQLASTALSLIRYTRSEKSMSLKISTTTVDLDDNAYIFYGHIYQLCTQSTSSWSQAVVDAHNTTITADDGTTENGYIATITSANENKMLLNMISKGSNSYFSTWVGGTSNYQDTSFTRKMDYDFLNQKIKSGASESTYFTDNTMKKSGNDKHNPLKGEDFYWIDGPEKGEPLPDGGDYWCDENHNKWKQNEPNDGHVVWAGYGGPYWDDIKLNQVNADTPVNYIVEFGGKINPSSGESTPITDAEAYRKITIEDIEITFNDNKTVPIINTVTVLCGINIALPKPTRAGYEFLGWSKLQSSTSYVGDSDNNYRAEQEITLYAQWQPLIQFESVLDSGIYATNNESKDNATQGAISFNFRVLDFGKNDFTPTLLDFFDNFYIRVNDKVNIKAYDSAKPTYDDYNNNISDEDNIGYWMHCVIENIQPSDYNTKVSAVPNAVTKEGEIITGDTVYKDVDIDNWVLMNW